MLTKKINDIKKKESQHIIVKPLHLSSSSGSKTNPKKP